MNKENVIICRCEDITLKDLHDLFNQGYTDFEEIKRLTRLGMGPCQANTCGFLVQREIAKFLGVSIDKVKTPKVRPPLMGVKLNAIKEGAEDES